MTQDQPPLPALWLLSDERNDRQLEQSLAALPKGSGFIFRHYHLDDRERQARFRVLTKLARNHDHIVILSGSLALASKWNADGIYGPPAKLRAPTDLLKLATAHDAKEIVAADRAGADAILLSPVFPTASHPGAQTLGPVRFRLLAQKAAAPVIALGGMTPETAKRLDWPRWAAIDGLS